MKLDIVFVTYNSEKWIKQCLKSIESSTFDLKKISLCFHDNCSSDKTIEILKNYQATKGSKYGAVEVIEGQENYGFGKGNNIATKKGSAEYVLFLNIDTEIPTDTLVKLEQSIENSSSEFAVWELRQEPYEHPKYYDLVTLETAWASGACLVVKRSVFEDVGGFDENIFMYDEDVDLSFNIRSKGHKIMYLFNIPITHYAYSKPQEFKAIQYISSSVNNLYLRCKYGSLGDILKGKIAILKRIIRPNLQEFVSKQVETKLRKQVFFSFLKMQRKYWQAISKRIFRKNTNDFKAEFFGFEYAVARSGAFYKVLEVDSTVRPLVSILVRTCNRPSILRETLISLRRQQYTNLEVVIVEDGPNVSETMLKNEFSDLNIAYKSTGKNIGRCKAGNIALEMATGKYLNFLDDDDLFYPDHVEVLVRELESSSKKIAYTTSFETKLEVLSKDPYRYNVRGVVARYNIPFNILELFKRNITPIQCVMFEKSVFEDCGGFDEAIDSLEDWDLWINFSLKYEFLYINKTTSLYRVPFKVQEIKNRDIFLEEYLGYLRTKYQNVEVQGYSPVQIINYSQKHRFYLKVAEILRFLHLGFIVKFLIKCKNILFRKK